MQTTKSKVQSNNLSFKLLKTIGGHTIDNSNSSRGIHQLKDLSNRIKQANKTFISNKSNHINRQTIKQELLDDGIDLDKDKLLVLQNNNIRKQRSIIIAQQIKEIEIPLISPMKDLSYTEFAHKAQQNLAYRGIYETLMVQSYIKDPLGKPDSKMKLIRRRNLNRMKTAKEENIQQISIQKRQSQTTKANLDKISEQFGRCLCESGVENLHEKLYRMYLKKDFIQDNEYRKWIYPLFHQIEISSFVYESLMQKNSSIKSKSTKNYVGTVSINALSELLAYKYEETKLTFQKDYFIQNQNHPEKIKWSQYYLSLITGKTSQFIIQLKNEDPSLAQQYENLLLKINEYEKPKISFSDIAVNNRLNYFEKNIKLIILGKYEPLFKNVLPKIRALQQPWFILMSLGFPKIEQRQETQRKKLLKIAVTDYYQSLTNQIFKQKLNNQLVSSFITGLTSLNNYTLLLKFYDQLTERNYLQNYPLYLDFVHLFIILAANPSLLYLQLSKFDAENVLQRCIQELSVYLKTLKSKNNSLFKPYFTSLLQILVQIKICQIQFPLQEIIQKIFNNLQVKTQDIQPMRRNDPNATQSYNQSVYQFQNIIIKHLHPKNEQQFIQLAHLCDLIDQPKLQEYILIKLIIFNYYQIQQEQNNQQNNTFANPQNETLIKQSRNITIAIDFLKDNMPLNRIQILHFLLSLKRLNQLLKSKRKDLLRKEQQQFRKYRNNNQRIFNYLIDMSLNRSSGYFDIFIHYYQKMLQLYSLIHFSSSSIDLFYTERTNLVNELITLKQNYPQIEGARYHKLMHLLNVRSQ